MIPDVLRRAAGAPMHIELLYAVVAAERPDLVDDEPDPDTPTQLKWQHDFRWELKTAVGAGRIQRRAEIGRGYYSNSSVAEHLIASELCTVRIAPIEKVTPEAFPVRSSTDARYALRSEAMLVHRYEQWASRHQRALGRLELKFPDGERLVADAYDVQRHLLIEAKGSSDRPSVRMALGQLFDYRFALGTEPAIAVLLPSKPAATLIRLLSSCDVGLIFESEPGCFEELSG